MTFIYWLLSMVVFFVVVGPIVTFIHELGHATAALLVSREPVTIILGTNHSGRSFRIGRLAIRWGALGGWVGFCNIGSVPDKRWKRILIRGMGPFFSILVALGAWALSTVDALSVISLDYLFRATSYAAVFQFVMTIVPMHYGNWNPGYSGMDSDGMKILREFIPASARSGRADEGR